MLTPVEDKWITVVTFLRDLRDRWAYVTNLYSANEVDEEWVKQEYEKNIARVEADLRTYLEGCSVYGGPSIEPSAGGCGDSLRSEGDAGGFPVVGPASACLPGDCPNADPATECACQDSLARPGVSLG